jgi:hypothetical protein
VEVHPGRACGRLWDRVWGQSFESRPGNPAVVARVGEVRVARRRFRLAWEPVAWAAAHGPVSPVLALLLAAIYKDSGCATCWQ